LSKQQAGFYSPGNQGNGKELVKTIKKTSRKDLDGVKIIHQGFLHINMFFWEINCFFPACYP